MAEIRLGAEELDSLQALLHNLADDEGLRRQMERDPAAVLGQFGLDSLVAPGAAFRVSVVEDEVSGYGHVDDHQDHHDHSDQSSRPILTLSLLP
jgi:hypothetical protein